MPDEIGSEIHLEGYLDKAQRRRLLDIATRCTVRFFQKSRSGRLRSNQQYHFDKPTNKPFLRKVIQRMPAFLRPKAIAYGHIFAIDDNGKVAADFQDPDRAYAINTSVTETDSHLYVGSLVAPVFGRLEKEKIALGASHIFQNLYDILSSRNFV